MKASSSCAVPRTDEELAQQAGLSLDAFHDTADRAATAACSQARSQRVRPHTDDKVLTAWNALTLRALAEAARSLGRADYLEAAQRNADFILDHLVVENRLYRAWRDGQARHPAYLEDYAALILGLLALYQADGDPRWFDWARRLGNELESAFFRSCRRIFRYRRGSGRTAGAPQGFAG